MSELTRRLKIDVPGKTFTEICAEYPRKVSRAVIRKDQDDICKIKDLIWWAKSTSASLKKAAEKCSVIGISNIYYAKQEWIDFELLPKLRKLYPIKKKVT